MIDIGKNLNYIRERIAAAAKKSGQSISDISIVAATKYMDAGIINGLSQYNITIAGENRVQDFISKYEQVNDPSIVWHFIGQLQTNKVKYIAGKVALIQSLDRLALAEEIERQYTLKDLPPVNALIEINLGGEEQKGGISPDGLLDFYNAVNAFKHINIKGLMTVMPKNAANGDNCRNLYLQMKQLYDILKDIDNNVNILSMGMSDDFETAIECGANMVRLGRVLIQD